MDFWDRQMMEEEILDDEWNYYSVKEIQQIFKKAQSVDGPHESTNSYLSRRQIVDIIRYYYPNEEIDFQGEKIFHIRCRLWDKNSDVEFFLQQRKITTTNQQQHHHSIKKTYNEYLKLPFYSEYQMKVSFSFFKNVHKRILHSSNKEAL